MLARLQELLDLEWKRHNNQLYTIRTYTSIYCGFGPICYNTRPFTVGLICVWAALSLLVSLYIRFFLALSRVAGWLTGLKNCTALKTNIQSWPASQPITARVRASLVKMISCIAHMHGTAPSAFACGLRTHSRLKLPFHSSQSEFTLSNGLDNTSCQLAAHVILLSDWPRHN